MAGSFTFADWNAVTDTYGSAVSNYLQQQGVPLSGVSQYISTNAPSFAQQFTGQGVQGSGGSTALLAELQGGKAGQQGQTTPPFNPTNNPQYMYSQLGAAVSGQPMVVNPNPSQQPISSKSGIYSGQQTPYVGTSTPSMPQGVWNQVPGLAGGQAPSRDKGPISKSVWNVPDPSQGNITPTAPAGGVSSPQQSGTPFATPPATPSATPPAAPTVNFAAPQGLPPSAVSEPGPMWGMVTNKGNLPGAIHTGNFGGNLAYAGGGTTPGTSAGSIALGKAMNTGGRVPGQGNTDTVPAMLTPGEFVMNKDAVQQIGVGNLQRMNQEPQHFADGGPVQLMGPGGIFQPNNPPGLNAPPDAQNKLAMAQALAIWGSGNRSAEAVAANNNPPGKSTYYGANRTPTGDSPSLNYYKTGSSTGGYNAAANQNQPPPPSYADYAPRASLVAPPAGYGAAPRAELVGLPAGYGEAYDPATYGIKTGPTQGQQMASGIAGGAQAAGQAIAQAFENNAKLSWTPQRSAIPTPPSYSQYYDQDILNQSRVT